MYCTLTLPVSAVMVGVDSVAQLEENVQMARDFTPLSESQRAAISQAAEPFSNQAPFFRFFERT